jgi:hypothetical protein
MKWKRWTVLPVLYCTWAAILNYVRPKGNTSIAAYTLRIAPNDLLAQYPCCFYWAEVTEHAVSPLGFRNKEFRIELKRSTFALHKHVVESRDSSVGIATRLRAERSGF